MTSLDVKFRKLATDKIAQFGKAVTHTVTTAGAYDPATGSLTPSTTTATLKAIISDYKPQAFGVGLVLAGDKKLSIAAADITAPKPGDTITLDGVVWTVMNVQETWSGEQVAMLDIQVRK